MKKKKVNALEQFMKSLDELPEGSQKLLVGGFQLVDGLNDGCQNTGDCRGSDNSHCTNSNVCFF